MVPEVLSDKTAHELRDEADCRSEYYIQNQLSEAELLQTMTGFSKSVIVLENVHGKMGTFFFFGTNVLMFEGEKAK